MRQATRLALILSAAPILALGMVTPSASPKAGCIRGVYGSRYNQRLFRSVMRRTDKVAGKFLTAYNVPRVKPSEVRPVNDPVICQRAAVAYGKALSAEDRDRRVHILRVGNRYIVMDPDFVVDNQHRAVTFDSTLTHPVALVAE
jgi:hypothetical protein